MAIISFPLSNSNVIYYQESSPGPMPWAPGVWILLRTPKPANRKVINRQVGVPHFKLKLWDMWYAYHSLRINALNYTNSSQDFNIGDSKQNPREKFSSYNYECYLLNTGLQTTDDQTIALSGNHVFGSRRPSKVLNEKKVHYM